MLQAGALGLPLGFQAAWVGGQVDLEESELCGVRLTTTWVFFSKAVSAHVRDAILSRLCLKDALGEIRVGVRV
jgi:hypothetical protein